MSQFLTGAQQQSLNPVPLQQEASIGTGLDRINELLDQLSKLVDGLDQSANRLHGPQPSAVANRPADAARADPPLIRRFVESNSRFELLVGQLALVIERIDRGL